MAMLHKMLSGTRLSAQTKTVDGGYGGVVYCGNEITNEDIATAPTDSAAETPYTKWLAKFRTTTAHRNLGGATKIDGTTIADDEVIRWYNLIAILKGRKIAKRYSKYGVAPTAPTTKLWDA